MHEHVNRIGIFICYCDIKVGSALRKNEVALALKHLPDVVHVEISNDLCLHAQAPVIKQTAAAKNLNAVVLTTCSSAIHAGSLRMAFTTAGIQSHKIEVLDLESLFSWPCAASPQETTAHVIDALKHAVAAVKSTEPPVAPASVIKRALVIGGGIAGIQTSLDIADAGYEVLLVEKTSSIGGHMLQYAEVFPTLDCPQCIGTPKMVEVGQHPNIKILACSEVESVSGTAGDFNVRIKRKATCVDWNTCNGCGLCQQKCPTKVPSEYNCRLPFNKRGAIYVPFAQAVPNKPVIDAGSCRYIAYRRFIDEGGQGKKPPECRVCEKLCPVKAIDWNQQDRIIDERVGTIVVATGFDLMSKSMASEFADDPDIINGLEFERILCPSGPTAGAVKRPSDNREPHEVVFVSCVGSRDPEHGVPYCSRVCCMYLVKQALLYRHVVHSGQAYLFYMDQRTTGKGYEEFAQRAVEEYGVTYLRGRVSKIYREGDQLMVLGADTLTGRRVEIPCDMVVLGMAMMPSEDGRLLARTLGIATNEHGFIAEAHAKLRPCDTSVAGIYVAGTAQGPRDIPDSVAMGSGAASRVLEFFAETNKQPAAVSAITASLIAGAEPQTER